MLAEGTVLQRGYTVVKVLGQGGMGTVYLARQTSLGERLVALKEIHLEASDPQLRAQLVELLNREARILASLEHPGVVKVMDFFAEGGTHYFVMEFIDGKSLQDACYEAPVALPQALDWADQLCDILSWLHERPAPVIVRDLKPSNVMLDRAGRLRIIDFGIAGVKDGQAKTQTVLKGSGTIGYAPVEQFGSKGNTDARADIYALGATLYSLLTAQVPPFSLDLATGDSELIPPRTINPQVTPELEAVVLKMMALKRDHRYPTVREARKALLDCASPAKAETPPPAPVMAPPPRPTEVPKKAVSVGHSKVNACLGCVGGFLFLFGIVPVGLVLFSRHFGPSGPPSETPRPSPVAGTTKIDPRRVLTAPRVESKNTSVDEVFAAFFRAMGESAHGMSGFELGATSKDDVRGWLESFPRPRTGERLEGNFWWAAYGANDQSVSYKFDDREVLEQVKVDWRNPDQDSPDPLGTSFYTALQSRLGDAASTRSSSGGKYYVWTVAGNEITYRCFTNAVGNWMVEMAASLPGSIGVGVD